MSDESKYYYTITGEVKTTDGEGPHVEQPVVDTTTQDVVDDTPLFVKTTVTTETTESSSTQADQVGQESSVEVPTGMHKVAEYEGPDQKVVVAASTTVNNAPQGTNPNVPSTQVQHQVEDAAVEAKRKERERQDDEFFGNTQ